MKSFLPLFLPLILMTGLINPQLVLIESGIVSDLVYNLVYSIYIFVILSYTYAYIACFCSGERANNRELMRRTIRLYFSFYPAKLMTWAFFSIFAFLMSTDFVKSNSLIEFLLIVGMFALWLIFSIRFSLAFIIIGEEKSGTINAFARSSRLMRMFWWKSFWAIFIIMFICFIIIEFGNVVMSLMINEIFDLHGTIATIQFFRILNLVIMLLSIFLGTVLVSVFSALNYYNLVARKEAPDLIDRINRMQSDNAGTVN